MIVDSDAPAFAAFIYFDRDPATEKAMPREFLQLLLDGLGLPEDQLRMWTFKTPFKEGRPRGFKRKAAVEAMQDPAVEVLNLRAGEGESISFSAKLQLRSDPDPARESLAPRRFFFACRAAVTDEDRVAHTTREMLRLAARSSAPVSAGVARAPSFNQAYCEVEDAGDRDREPTAFQERIRVDRRYETARWTKARRLYPLTLLGPKIASQLSADDARKAGALAVEELNGSLLIDAYPTLIETWSPDFLKATVDLRRWLWPYTIQNRSDSVGLGVKPPSWW